MMQTCVIYHAEFAHIYTWLVSAYRKKITWTMGLLVSFPNQNPNHSK